MSKIVLSKDDFEAFWEATVRYYELDPQGVMHNANHVALFDQAITSYYKHVNYDYMSDIEETKKDFHTVQVLAQYNKPLYFDQDIEIGVKVKEIGNSSMTWIMGMFLKETGDLVSSCEAVHVYTDQTTMKPTPITDELKAKLKFN
ncbi:MAG: thioesterase [Actinobacteria bacterium]|nr:thioesterase [Actinomycetota bacterium]